MIARNLTYIGILGALIASCTPAPKEAYYNRGEPESLLDVSTEVVNVKINSPASVQEVVDVINKEQPTRAEVSCKDGDPLCKEVKHVMRQFKVNAKYTAGHTNAVAIYYERVLARDCQNRYIDLTTNMNNLNSPTFGCSTAVNMLQMVSDKRQLTNPPMLDVPDANKAIQAVGNYDSVAKPDTNFQPMVENASTTTR